MTNKRRNLFIILLVLGLLAGSAVAIVQKPTRLGLDLSGGVELVYEAEPTPQVPEVTPQAIDDAIETIRKRTDALGVSEPEIQRAASNQISVGLPDVENVDQAIEQVGTTAQLQFYDWEPNVFTSEGPLQTLVEAQESSPQQDPNALTRPLELFEAVERATEAEPAAEPEDVPPSGVDEAELPDDVSPDDRQAVEEFYDQQNDSQGSDQYYLFGPDEELIAGPSPDCEELFSEFDDDAPAGGGQSDASQGGECQEELGSVSTEEVPEGSQVLVVPRGIRVIEAQRPPNLPADAPFDRYQIIEDDSELSGDEIVNPEQGFDPQTNQPIVTFEFSDEGQQAFAAVTQRIAERGQALSAFLGQGPQSFQRFAITLDEELISLATIDYIENPSGIDGRTGASIENIGSLEETQDLAENLRIGALPIDLQLISNTQVSASLGQQALDQGLIAGLAGLALTLLFLVAFYRVLGLVASLALITYAVFLFALVKLVPVTLTLPGIAGLVLTLAVAADANIVIFERIKEEARAGRSIPAAITAGYGKALRTIIDANVVTIGVAFILFMLATAGVKGFALMMGLGTIVSLFTAVLATSAILGSISRSRILRSRHALGAGREHTGWKFDFMGKSRWFFSASGLILVIGALAIAGLGINFGIDFESGTRIQTPLEEPASVDEVRAALPAEFQDSEVQEVEAPELGENVVQISVPELAPDQQDEVRDALDQAFGSGPRRVLHELDRADLRRPDRADRADRGDRVADPDLALHRRALRVQVRGAGADRDRARHPDHGGRLRPGRPGGHERDGGGAAHDPRLLALRHDHRVRPHPRERAADAARHLQPDRQPVDVRGAHPLARHQLLDAASDHRADAVRRRDPARLRLRAARGHGLRRLLVDLHRVSGALALEGARAHLPAPAAPGAAGARRHGARVRLGHDRPAARPRRAPGRAGRRRRPAWVLRAAARARAGWGTDHPATAPQAKGRRRRASRRGAPAPRPRGAGERVPGGRPR